MPYLLPKSCARWSSRWILLLDVQLAEADLTLRMHNKDIRCNFFAKRWLQFPWRIFSYLLFWYGEFFVGLSCKMTEQTATSRQLEIRRMQTHKWWLPDDWVIIICDYLWSTLSTKCICLPNEETVWSIVAHRVGIGLFVLLNHQDKYTMEKAHLLVKCKPIISHFITYSYSFYLATEGIYIYLYIHAYILPRFHR